MPVHYAGHPVSMDELMPWAREKGLKVIEDCAHTSGSLYKGTPLGLWGDIGCYSFEEKKLMTTGDGGMMVTNQPGLFKDVKAMRWVGIDKDNWKTAQAYTNANKDAMHWFYELNVLGYKYNMNDLSAAIGLAQLKKLPEFNRIRGEIIQKYLEGLKGVDGIKPLLPYEPDKYVYQMFGIRAERRDDLMIYLKSKGIATGCHYTPLHTQPFYIEVDEIYNLACPASPVHFQYNPIKTIKTSVMGSVHMLGLAKRIKAKILQASTSEVYGDPEEHPQKESYWGNVNPIGRRASYNEGKRCAETLFMDYHIQNNVKIKIARIFNTYGPKMLPNDGRVISNFIMQALRGEDITLYGDGRQTRSFQYIDDLVEALIRLMEDTPDEFTGPVNLGNPHEYEIKALAGQILKYTGSSSRLKYYPLPEDDPTRRKPDISQAREVLNWEPGVHIDEGLQKTIAYFKTIPG